MVDRIMSTRKYSILYFVVKSLHEQDPKRLSFTQNYSDITRAMRYSLSDFEKSKLEYTKSFEKVRDEVEIADKLVQDLKDNPEETENHMTYQLFIDNFKPFLQDADRRLELVNDSFNKIKAKASKCAEFYGLKPSSTPEEILSILNSFLESLRKHHDTIIRAEQAAKRKAELELKKQLIKETSKTGGPKKVIDASEKPEKPKLIKEADEGAIAPTNSQNPIKESPEGEVITPNLATSDLSKSNRGHTVYHPPGIIRPTGHGGPIVPVLRPQNQAGGGSRPQAANRKRVAVNDQYKKKEEKAEKILEFSSSKISRTTKFQRETVNLSKISLP